MKTFDGLTVAQDRAFGSIAIGQPPRCTPKTIAVLLERGLVEADERVVGRDVLGPITVTDYYVPIDTHARWCLWCAENISDEPAAAPLSPGDPG